VKPLKVLALTRYTRLGASSRLRIEQFVGPLAERNITVDVRPLLGDVYLKNYYDGQPTSFFWEVVWPMLRRLATMLSANNYDVVWLQKEMLPYFPWVMEHLFAIGMPPIVVDYDDATFHQYDLSKSALTRAILGRKIDNVMKAANTVIVGNAYLHDRARLAGARTIVDIPTVLDPQRYLYKSEWPKSRFRIGWIGTKSTSDCLVQIAPALIRAQEELGAEIIIIGVDKLDIPRLRADFLSWSEETEAEKLSTISVGVMPLGNSPWDFGKCGYKLLQYMASGIPAVASPVGANAEIVIHGSTGFHATTQEDWFGAFKFVHTYPRLAEKIGAAARLRVINHYSIDFAMPLIEKSLRDAAL
jgi:glycosyltransferase involved in cell wall biosynthesis